MQGVICTFGARIPRMRYIASFGVSDRRIANMSVTRCVICLLRKRDMFAMRTLYHFEGGYSAALITFPFGEGGPLAVDEVNFYHSNTSQPHPSCFASHLPKRGRFITTVSSSSAAKDLGGRRGRRCRNEIRRCRMKSLCDEIAAR